jgi:hypothetical protein
MAIYKQPAPAPSAGIVRLFPKLRQLFVMKFCFSLIPTSPFQQTLGKRQSAIPSIILLITKTSNKIDL